MFKQWFLDRLDNDNQNTDIFLCLNNLEVEFMTPLFQKHPKIITKSEKGKSNGWLVPIFNVHESMIDVAQHPKQVYLTVIALREVKGPHLHLKRWGLFTCIRGNAKIVVRTEKGYEEYFTGEAAVTDNEAQRRKKKKRKFQEKSNVFDQLNE